MLIFDRFGEIKRYVSLTECDIHQKGEIYKLISELNLNVIVCWFSWSLCVEAPSRLSVKVCVYCC